MRAARIEELVVGTVRYPGKPTVIVKAFLDCDDPFTKSGHRWLFKVEYPFYPDTAVAEAQALATAVCELRELLNLYARDGHPEAQRILKGSD